MTELITAEQAKRLTDVLEFLRGGECEITITSEPEYQGAADLIKRLKAERKTLDMDRKAAKERPLDECRTIDETYRDPVALLDEKVRAIETAGRIYRREQERLALAEQMRQDEEARRAREKAEHEAAAARAKASQHAENGKNGLAEKWEQRAQQAEQLAASTVAPIVDTPATKTERGSFDTRKYYAARIINANAAIKWAVDNNQWHLVLLDEKIIGSLARASKGAPCMIPGVQFYEK